MKGRVESRGTRAKRLGWRPADYDGVRIECIATRCTRGTGIEAKIKVSSVEGREQELRFHATGAKDAKEI
jgi:hypothetical protein